ncbi:MAG: hypothetical protein A2Y77_00095 [Planctomycetes bacterium RBG_13_62_9]|nr:MAG: hypothetical protein A2Y77_00095 [Planctomycetes bacterium RBG_13_62_9]
MRRERNRRVWNGVPGLAGMVGESLCAPVRRALINLHLWTMCALGIVLMGFLLSSAAAGQVGDSTAPSPLEQTLAGIRECMGHLPAPWPQEWQREYVDTIRRAAESHRDAPQYAQRLDILAKGFPAYWQGLKTGKDRSLFELHCAQICWYVESLMAAELLDGQSREALRNQYKALWDHAAGELLSQFPFLDPNAVHAAQADHLAECYRTIEAPLLPIYQHPLSDAQIEQIKNRWHDLRYARVDLWRQLRGDDTVETQDFASQLRQTNPPVSHRHYLLTQRSLAQLQPHVWAVAAPAPDYYRGALARQIEAEKHRLQAMSQASRDERGLEQQYSRQIWQAEQLAFLLAALLESPACFDEPLDRPMEGNASHCRDARFCVSPAQTPLPQEDSAQGGSSHD